MLRVLQIVFSLSRRRTTDITSLSLHDALPISQTGNWLAFLSPLSWCLPARRSHLHKSFASDLRKSRIAAARPRSEERRVGKEWRTRGARYKAKTKHTRWSWDGMERVDRRMSDG